MEDIKDKIIIIFVSVIFIALSVLAVYLLLYQSSYYYSKIDNIKIEKIESTDNMRYQYTLNCYDEKGKEKEIKFKTSRELKEGAYIKLKVMITRGVISWEEAEYEELPSLVKSKYAI